MADKKPKASVDYSLGGDACDFCVHFTDEDENTGKGQCELVAGEISEDYWCKLFKRAKEKTNSVLA